MPQALLLCFPLCTMSRPTFLSKAFCSLSMNIPYSTGVLIKPLLPPLFSSLILIPRAVDRTSLLMKSHSSFSSPWPLGLSFSLLFYFTCFSPSSLQPSLPAHCPLHKSNSYPALVLCTFSLSSPWHNLQPHSLPQRILCLESLSVQMSFAQRGLPCCQFF